MRIVPALRREHIRLFDAQLTMRSKPSLESVSVLSSMILPQLVPRLISNVLTASICERKNSASSSLSALLRTGSGMENRVLESFYIVTFGDAKPVGKLSAVAGSPQPIGS